MNLTDTSLRLTLGTNIVPSGIDVTGNERIGRSVTAIFPDATIAWCARLVSSGGTASVNFHAGTISPSTTVSQVETATVTAASGCTASGNLAITVTGAHIGGSPLAVSVPLVTGVHNTADKIAQAICDVFNATYNIARDYTVTAWGGTVILTRKANLDCLNDATLNIAIAAGLGVSAAATSANTASGIRGVSVTRIGGDGKDLNGATLPSVAYYNAVALFNTMDSNGQLDLTQGGVKVAPSLDPNGLLLMANSLGMESANLSTPVVFGTAGTPWTVDLIFFGSPESTI